jgi:hypothetical protein
MPPLGLVCLWLSFRSSYFSRVYQDSWKTTKNAFRKSLIFDKDHNYVDSGWSDLKISVWILLSLGCGIAAYYQLPNLFPSVFKTP